MTDWNDSWRPQGMNQGLWIFPHERPIRRKSCTLLSFTYSTRMVEKGSDYYSSEREPKNFQFDEEFILGISKFAHEIYRLEIREQTKRLGSYMEPDRPLPIIHLQ